MLGIPLSSIELSIMEMAKSTIVGNFPVYSYILLFIIVAFIFYTIKYYVKLPIPDKSTFNLERFIADPAFDCDTGEVYCFDDVTCSTKCNTIADTFGCVNGVCRKNIMLSEEARNECDVKEGLVAFASFDPLQNVTFQCKSIDPYVRPDLVEDPLRMCKNGDIVYSYIEKYPAIADCTCPSNLTTNVVEGSGGVRKYVVCVDKNFDGIYTRYDREGGV